MHKTDDERRTDRIVEDLGGITYVDSTNWLTQCNPAGFGPFELNVAERSLREGEPGHSTWWQSLRHPDCASRKRAVRLSRKAELIAKAWPDVTVEEGSLRVHLSSLRKALGDGQFGDKYIANIQGRGYSFIAPVARLPTGPRQR